MLAGLALALRFVPYSDHTAISPRLVARDGAIGLIVVAASVYLVYVLEILKFRRLDTVRAASPAARRRVSRRSSSGVDRSISRPASSRRSRQGR